MNQHDKERLHSAMLALQRLTETKGVATVSREDVGTLTVALTIVTWLMRFEPEVAEAAVQDIALMADELREPHAYLH